MALFTTNWNWALIKCLIFECKFHRIFFLNITNVWVKLPLNQWTLGSGEGLSCTISTTSFYCKICTSVGCTLINMFIEVKPNKKNSIQSNLKKNSIVFMLIFLSEMVQCINVRSKGLWWKKKNILFILRAVCHSHLFWSSCKIAADLNLIWIADKIVILWHLN